MRRCPYCDGETHIGLNIPPKKWFYGGCKTKGCPGYKIFTGQTKMQVARKINTRPIHHFPNPDGGLRSALHDVSITLSSIQRIGDLYLVPAKIHHYVVHLLRRLADYDSDT